VTSRTLMVLNAGSSSIKFAVFDLAIDTDPPPRLCSGSLSGIGASGQLKIESAGRTDTNDIAAPTHASAIASLLEALRSHASFQNLQGIGHRIVHGGPEHYHPQPVDPKLLTYLRTIIPFAPEHLPQAIALIEAISQQFPSAPQFVCFDTAFHHDLPVVARTLPLPRRYQAMGVRRYGFHGLSYEYLMRTLARVGEDRGRVILAHLGNGASMAAVHDGKPIDTTMGMTPAGGLVMGSRTGDIDPGITRFLQLQEKLTPDQFNRLVNHESGMRGVSEVTSDMRQLVASQQQDMRAAEAVELFCYSARKWIGALFAALGGLDTLVFSGGIGEHQAEVRQRICQNLDAIGINIDPDLNAADAAIISGRESRVKVRVIATDEESTIFHAVKNLLSTNRSHQDVPNNKQ